MNLFNVIHALSLCGVIVGLLLYIFVRAYRDTRWLGWFWYGSMVLCNVLSIVKVGPQIIPIIGLSCGVIGLIAFVGFPQQSDSTCSSCHNPLSEHAQYCGRCGHSR